MEMQERLVVLDKAVREYRKHIKRKQMYEMGRRDLVKNHLGYRITMAQEKRDQYAEDAQAIIDGLVKNEPIPERMQGETEQLRDDVLALERLMQSEQAMVDRMWELMGEHAVELPVWQYARDITALTASGLGLIVGVSAGVAPEDKEAGREVYSGLERFPSPAKLWSWWGMPVDENGRRPKVRPCDRQGLAHGCLGIPLRNMGDGYKRCYYARKARTSDTNPEWPAGRQDNDAVTVMCKKLLKYIWIAWHDPETDKTVHDEEMWGYYDAVTEIYDKKI